MLASHASKVPPVVAEYMKLIGNTEPYWHPTIREYFTPGKGWKRYPGSKRISASWAYKLRASEGVTHLALSVAPGRVADFSIAELVKGPGMSWPLA